MSESSKVNEPFQNEGNSEYSAAQLLSDNAASLQEKDSITSNVTRLVVHQQTTGEDEKLASGSPVAFQQEIVESIKPDSVTQKSQQTGKKDQAVIEVKLEVGDTKMLGMHSDQHEEQAAQEDVTVEVAQEDVAVEVAQEDVAVEVAQEDVAVEVAQEDEAVEVAQEDVAVEVAQEDEVEPESECSTADQASEISTDEPLSESSARSTSKSSKVEQSTASSELILPSDSSAGDVEERPAQIAERCKIPILVIPDCRKDALNHLISEADNFKKHLLLTKEGKSVEGLGDPSIAKDMERFDFNSINDVLKRPWNRNIELAQDLQINTRELLRRYQLKSPEITHNDVKCYTRFIETLRDHLNVFRTRLRMYMDANNLNSLLEPLLNVASDFDGLLHEELVHNKKLYELFEERRDLP